MMDRPLCSVDEGKRAETRAFAAATLKPLLAELEEIILHPYATYGDRRYFAEVAEKTRSLIRAIG